jgi:hypothetical protein
MAKKTSSKQSTTSNSSSSLNTPEERKRKKPSFDEYKGWTAKDWKRNVNDFYE